MITQIYNLAHGLDDELITKAANTLKSGGLVAFPTETVYGLGGNALDALSCRKIYMAKGRPSDNPLILHISDKNDLAAFVKNVPGYAQRLIDAFWPGALTLVFEKSGAVPYETCGGLSTVAIRMPSHRIARALIHACGFPIAAPSANLSGKPSPTTAAHVIEDLFGKIDVIIDGGNTTFGLESTIVDVSGSVPCLLRPGSVTLEMLRTVCSDIVLDATLLKKPDEAFAPKAPGMKYTHYAPNARVTLVRGSEACVSKFINEQAADLVYRGKLPAVIASNESAPLYTCEHVFAAGSKQDMAAFAFHIFSLLRRADELNITDLFCECVTENGVGLAVMNRLLKASGYHVVEV